MRLALSGLCVVLATAAAACSGGGGSTSTVTPAQGPAPTPVTIKIAGTEPVVLVLNAATAGDAIELARLTGYSAKPCSSGGTAGLPPCRDSEQDGTEVNILAQMSCDRSWIRPELVADAYMSAFRDGAQLVALYKPKPGAAALPADLDIEYVMVLQTGTRPEGTQDGVALHIRDGRVVMIERPCIGFLQLLAPERVGSFVVRPTPAGASR